MQGPSGGLLIETFPVGEFQCNCTVLADEKTREALVIDPGDEGERILEVLAHYDLKVKALVHTHAHLDHIMATTRVKEKAGDPGESPEILLHEGDRWLYENLPMQAGFFGWNAERPSPPDRALADGDVVRFGGHTMEVLHTPGHTPGSVCLLLRTAPLLFAGDTLFRRSIGRTDLWGGDYDTIVRSIRERLFSLDEGLRVVCGHGPETRIGEERRGNPFVGD